MIKGILEKLAILIDDVNEGNIKHEEIYVYLQDIHADLFLATDGGECDTLKNCQEYADMVLQELDTM